MIEEELRAALALPETSPGNPSEVEVRETHISWIFLAGERAYKLKKPLVLPFLDYGSPERRREMCREEVRLNRRLADDLYLGVRGVAPDGQGGFALTGEDDPRAVDFVVEMLRYDEDRTLAATLERGVLRAADVVRVARTLAAFHAACPLIPDGHEGARRIEREVERNLEQLQGVAELADERRRIGSLGRFLAAFVASRRGELDARAKRGCVRDCHGDLRAEHVLLGDQVTVVDCVEFDPSLRAIDMADDLAFLVMDLTALGGERFAAMLVSEYRDAGGDCGESSLLSFFAVHRALVRAKVLLVRAGQLAPGNAAHGYASAQARERLVVAERFAWRARLPLAVVVCGVPASGKSHLASELARHSDLAMLGSDRVRKEVAGISPSTRASPEHYSAEFSRAIYSELGPGGRGSPRPRRRHRRRNVSAPPRS